MEIRKFWMHLLLWTYIINLTMVLSEENVSTSIQLQPVMKYTWSSWSSWLPCSKSCGGGVAVQERRCVLRDRDNSSIDSSTVPAKTVIRISREAKECSGSSRRYHECNTAPCPLGEVDSRAEQCAAYDRRPFRGRFYTWVSYIDGNAPCTLNCRPLGRQFYATLSLVTDGTPCTKPGYRAICVQGECKVVGRETVLAGAGSKEFRCGNRLVSGVFSRPRLPLGYSHIATVPRGACSLNITEMLSQDNYIALKLQNGSYIMNGEFAVSVPGAYDAGGARFQYTRTGGRDHVFCAGPLQHPVDIMILFTQPGPIIKYEYFTESNGDISIESMKTENVTELNSDTRSIKHVRKHHDFPRASERFPNSVSMSKEASDEEFGENIIGGRRFLWKIMSYTQCSRSCGGGIQIGKFRCIESNPDELERDVSAVHCTGSAPPARRRRCGNIQCPPRWRTASWSSCPKCGPALKTRIVGCVQDHSRGIIKVSDVRCPFPKPEISSDCDVPICSEFSSKIDVKRVSKKTKHTDSDNFREGPVYTVTIDNPKVETKPEYSFSPMASWLHTEWSECVGWCVGEGLQTRHVRCSDPSGCLPLTPPAASRVCTPDLACESADGQWFTSDWSPCSSKCGGKQIRGIICIGGNGRRLVTSSCKGPKPNNERECPDTEECESEWHTSEWGECSGKCVPGENGIQRRSVVCTKNGNDVTNDKSSNKDKIQEISEAKCKKDKPISQRICEVSCTVSDNKTVNNILTTSTEINSESSTSSEVIKSTTTKEINFKENEINDCDDKLPNCSLAVQARLCRYNYYIRNCCNSCKKR